VGNVPIPDDLKPFPIFRSRNPDSKTKKVKTWWLKDLERDKTWEVAIALIDPSVRGVECKGPVAVEKLHFLQNSRNLGDRKCLERPRKSFVGHPSAILFWRISQEGVFQQPRPIGALAEFARNACRERSVERHGHYPQGSGNPRFRRNI
jgi:hypothetical protein